jgi:hypothetical protein
MEIMIQSMMKRFPLFIAMGFMIVIAALIIGAVNAGNAASYYAVDKATRDASPDLAQLRAGIESITVWLPYFKFLGLAMILAGITMALGMISLRLQELGKRVMDSVPERARIALPPKPKSATWMRIFMMLGMMIIIAGFIVSLSIASLASWVYSHPVVDIDAAAAGSDLLAGLARVHAAEAWLEAFKFVGTAVFFLGIVYGLDTIVVALKFQRSAIPQVVEELPADARLQEEKSAAPAAAD